MFGKALRLLGIGWYVAICIGTGALGGLWIDGKFDLRPVFTLLGLGLGVALAFLGMIRMLSTVLSDPPDREG